jgi:DNA-directed RNA polymerase subunit K/omega
MSRYTSEEAVAAYGAGRFEMILAAAQRSREIKNGSMQKVEGKDASSNVTALREIASGHYTRKDFLATLKTRKKNEYHSA